ncbi:MAG: outer membrane protein transport protein [Candidatus Thiodiazotropha sp. (ex Troendleina suluensis)]|nr:outer membrane protein transport protein [Candidatus Thiodiazotropha sp. (ex Troendleina suluensis)]
MAAVVVTSIYSTTDFAGPHGYDLHNTLAPASGGMAGASLARPQDLTSTVFGNPATLSQFKGTKFSFGATFYMPEVDLTHDGSITGTAFNENSGTDIFAVPNVAVTQDLRGLGLPATIGLGLTAVSGIGAEFRGNPGSLGAGADFIILGVNAGLGYEVSNNLSLGFAATISFAELDLGLSSTSAATHDIGLRGTFGATYDTGATTVGAYYQTELKHTFDNQVQISATSYASPEIEQPANIGFGIANNSLMNGNLLLALDITHKFWDDSKFWQDVYDDQTVISLGAQLTQGSWKYRIGYGYGDDPTDTGTAGPIGGISQVFSNVGPIPLNQQVTQYIQATQAEVIYKHRLTLGFGYQGFIAPPIDLDAHFGWQFKEDRDYGTGSLTGGGHTNAETYSWHTGFALTWNL